MVESSGFTSATPALPWFSPRQRQLLQGWMAELGQAREWSGSLPVALLERCWLRLRAIPVAELALALPPDASAAAPELERYRELVGAGLSAWSAQMHCWQEFGAASCQQAQRRFWQCQERGNHGWTLADYADLVDRYRRSVEGAGAEGSGRRLPLLVLARPASGEAHQLHWLEPLGSPMRHTCA